MRILGLDVGHKRIGIALSDPMGWTAQAHSVLNRSSVRQDMNYIAELCREQEVHEIVIGKPLNMDGTMGDKVSEINEFADQLAGYTSIPITLWDERLTTVSAERILIEADVSRAKRKGLVDKIAAAYILQAYLDKKSFQGL